MTGDKVVKFLAPPAARWWDRDRLADVMRDSVEDMTEQECREVLRIIAGEWPRVVEQSISSWVSTKEPD